MSKLLLSAVTLCGGAVGVGDRDRRARLHLERRRREREVLDHDGVPGCAPAPPPALARRAPLLRRDVQGDDRADDRDRTARSAPARPWAARARRLPAVMRGSSRRVRWGEHGHGASRIPGCAGCTDDVPAPILSIRFRPSSRGAGGELVSMATEASYARTDDVGLVIAIARYNADAFAEAYRRHAGAVFALAEPAALGAVAGRGDGAGDLPAALGASGPLRPGPRIAALVPPHGRARSVRRPDPVRLPTPEREERTARADDGRRLRPRSRGRATSTSPSRCAR